MDDPIHTYQTDHFVFWWSTESAKDSIVGDARLIAPGDSVPGLVRAAAEALEKAWRGYVDTLGYLPPKASNYSLNWSQLVPIGKYPVEICNVANALDDIGSSYYGAAVPDGVLGRSYLLLAADIVNFGGWEYFRDLDGSKLKMSYQRDWRSVIQATCAHELFHAVQFNYERRLNNHSYYEASAVTMEGRMVPQSFDYLMFARNLSRLDQLQPFPKVIKEGAYAQGWMVRTMAMDLGIDVLKALWEARRKSPSDTFLSTLREVLPQHSDASNAAGSFEKELIRQAVRVGLTGKRSGWSLPELAGFIDAGEFPTLTGTLPIVDTLAALPLDLGAIQVMIDTAAHSTDRVMVWIPDQGAQMAHVKNNGVGTSVSWESGSVRYSASDAPRSIWAFANPGNPPVLRAFARSEYSVSRYSNIAAPARTPAHAGQILTWVSDAGPTLKGVPRAEVLATPLLHLDAWRPSADKDPFAASIVSGTTGHAIVLEDADRSLMLSRASLDIPDISSGVAYAGSGDGNWSPVPITATQTGSVLELGDVDLSKPVRILVGEGARPGASALVPRPNPSRKGEAILFPISGARGAEKLDILAADGGLVREFHPVAGQIEVAWDLRNRENHLVRPGIYWYVWSGVSGAGRGKLLVAD